jgi:hypothetical protein
MKYICNTTCWVGGCKKAMFIPGDIVDFTEKEQVPGHFTCIEPKPEIKEEPKKEEVIIVPEPTDLISTDSFNQDAFKTEEETKPKRRPTHTKE